MNKTVTALAIVAVLAAAALVASTMVTDQAFAHKKRHHHHHDSVSSSASNHCTNSNCIAQSNAASASASGDHSIAANIQVNQARIG
jgi:uncharacterized low-complexity protein